MVTSMSSFRKTGAGGDEGRRLGDEARGRWRWRERDRRGRRVPMAVFSGSMVKRS